MASNINYDDFGIKLSLFIDKFYEPNKDQIFMSPEQTYPIDKENMKKWRQKICDKNTIKTCEELSKYIGDNFDEKYKNFTFGVQEINFEEKKKYVIDALKYNSLCPENDKEKELLYKYNNLFADIFCKTLRHVSFTEMINKIEKISEEIINLNNTKNYEKIYLFIDGNVSKSNLWIALLFISYLKK